MSLTEAGEALLRMQREGGGGMAEQRTAEEAFTAELARARDPAEIERVLAADAYDDLPISLKSAAYERRLEIGPRTAAVLRGYADHLWLHGPDWDEKAEALKAEADRLEG
jgi:hypothetical protein